MIIDGDLICNHCGHEGNPVEGTVYDSGKALVKTDYHCRSCKEVVFQVARKRYTRTLNIRYDTLNDNKR